nr:helix-turn-helix transcriptional regulator [Maliibacterium massiliense]
MDVAGRLKYFLTQKKMTANALAHQAGISQSGLSGILNGKKAPTVTTLEHICGALDITLAQFFAEDAGLRVIQTDAGADLPPLEIAVRQDATEARIAQLQDPAYVQMLSQIVQQAVAAALDQRHNPD